VSRRLAGGVDDAPAASPAETVTAVIAVGANLGDRAATVAAAIEELSRLPLTSVQDAAEPLETVALTPTGLDETAPGYLNTVVIVRTRLAPRLLLHHLHAIEERHGRPARTADTPRWQDRTLDLDLIAYGEAVSDDPTLTLPHPRAAERDFVLAPWASIAPDAVLPGLGRVTDLLDRLRRLA
jgi:2-amino-4-hydroxy-6-hydroxymethyldihydropteridine diphosphokinase